MKKIRYIIEAVLLYLLMNFSKLLPVQWASAFGGWVGRMIGPRLATSRKAINNIQKSFPDKSDTDVQKILIGMWDNLGRVMMEYPHLKHISRDRTEIIHPDILKQYKGKAAIVIAAHLGNWEICPPAMFLQHDLNSVPIYRAPNNPYTDKMLLKARSLHGQIQAIPKSKSGTRHIVKHLQEGSFIGVLIDQKYNEGIASNFLGRPAMTSPAFAQLAQKFDCPIIPLRLERLKGPNFRITASSPLDITNKTSEEIIEMSHRLLEEWITDKPEQWLWLHRRWDSKHLKK